MDFVTWSAFAGTAAIGYVIGALMARGGRADAEQAHQRASDALATLRARVDRALAAETPGAAPAAKRICRILRGEE